MSLIERIQELQDAYAWEQTRLQTWIDEMTNSLTAEDEANPMTVRFKDTWERYFAEIQESNQSVIDICQDSIDAETDMVKTRKQKDSIHETTVRKINEENHRSATIFAIADAAQIRKTQSKYFESLDHAIALEAQALGYIARHLEGS
jgi:hypothetical protein